MNRTIRVSHDVAAEAATALGRDVLETGVDRPQAAIMADVPPVLTVEEELLAAQRAVRAVVGDDCSVYAMREVHWSCYRKQVDLTWTIRIFPDKGRSCGSKSEAKLADAIDAALTDWRVSLAEADFRRKLEGETARLRAIEEGTKNETNAGADDCQTRPHGTGAACACTQAAESAPASSLDPNAAHKAEFLENMDRIAAGDLSPRLTLNFCHRCGADCGPIPVDALTPEQMARFNAAGWVRECTACLVREAENE